MSLELRVGDDNFQIGFGSFREVCPALGLFAFLGRCSSSKAGRGNEAARAIFSKMFYTNGTRGIEA